MSKFRWLHLPGGYDITWREGVFAAVVFVMFIFLGLTR